jgi:hypothetical protein
MDLLNLFWIKDRAVIVDFERGEFREEFVEDVNFVLSSRNFAKAQKSMELSPFKVSFRPALLFVCT